MGTQFTTNKPLVLTTDKNSLHNQVELYNTKHGNRISLKNGMSAVFSNFELNYFEINEY